MSTARDRLLILLRDYADTIRDSKVFPANQPPAGPPPAVTGKENFDIPALDAIVKYTGTVNGPTYKYTIDEVTLR